MIQILDSRVTFRRFLSIAIPVAAIALGTTAVAGTRSVDSLQPVGTVRVAMASSTQSVDITGTDTPPVKVLSASISVPFGKQADIQATFTASLIHLTGGAGYAYCFGTFNLDAGPPYNQFKPGSFQLLGGAQSSEPDAVGVAMTGFKKGVGPGTHAINVYVTSAYSGCELQERALNVVVNIR
jgi:hypothetical protein